MKKNSKKEHEKRIYERAKNVTAARMAEYSEAGRDIGPIRKLTKKQDALRRACKCNLKLFLEKIMPGTFTLSWSDVLHLPVIRKIQDTVLEGGLFALAMPRGAGKSSIILGALIWALCYSHRRYQVVVGCEQSHGEQLLSGVKTVIECSQELESIFPEICFPVSKIAGISSRCKGQLVEGQRTNITWSADKIILPTVDGYDSSGNILVASGITSSKLRGLSHLTMSGENLRPDFLVCDDINSSTGAASQTVNESKERIVSELLSIAGPGKKISGFALVTCVLPDDIACRLLDRGRNPDWRGETLAMILRWGDMTLWEKYNEIRVDALRNEGNIARATEFYREHQGEMDAGFEVSWNDRKNKDELSAVQHAMNLYYRDPSHRSFFSEYQNQPIPLVELAAGDMTTEEIEGKINNRARGEVPQKCVEVTAMVDVHHELLYYAVCAWEENFTGYIIDYGTFPRQNTGYFTLRDASITLSGLTAAGLEGRLFAGLEACTSDLLGREFEREGGGRVRISKCLIDANDGTVTDLIYQFCRQSIYSALILPSHGKYIGAASSSMSEWARRPGEKRGLNWLIPSQSGSKRTIKKCLFDTNFWKSFVFSRLGTAPGDPGGLSIFGSKSGDHRLLVEHLTAEYRVRVEGRGRALDEWRLRPQGSKDNHWLDCVVACAVAASVQGCQLSPGVVVKEQKHKSSEIKEQVERQSVVLRDQAGCKPAAPAKVKLSELYAQKHGGHAAGNSWVARHQGS